MLDSGEERVSRVGGIMEREVTGIGRGGSCESEFKACGIQRMESKNRTCSHGNEKMVRHAYAGERQSLPGRYP